MGEGMIYILSLLNGVAGVCEEWDGLDALRLEFNTAVKTAHPHDTHNPPPPTLWHKGAAEWLKEVRAKQERLLSGERVKQKVSIV